MCKTRIYTHVQVFKGDKIMTIDGQAVQGGQIIPALKGVDKPGSIVTLGLQRKSGAVEDVKLKRMANTQIADKRQLFELFTKLYDRANKSRDSEAAKYVQSALDLWTAEMMEEFEHDELVAHNVHDMQVQTA